MNSTPSENREPAGKLIILYRPAQKKNRPALQAAWKDSLGTQILALQRELGFVRYTQFHSLSSSHALVQISALTRSKLAAFFVSLTARSKGYVPGDKNIAALAKEERWCLANEIWWSSAEAMLGALTSEEGLAALHRMRELQAPCAVHTATLVCQERIIAAPRKERSDAVRIGFLLRSRPHDTPKQMQTYWEEKHAALVGTLTRQLDFDQYDRAPVLLTDLRVKRVIEALGGTQDHPYLGVASLSYPSSLHLILRVFRPAFQWANFKLMQDELGFIDPPASPSFLGTRVTVATGLILDKSNG